MNRISALPLDELTAACAARTPTPGGGAGCAAIAALGAALGTMAARYTVGRKGFEHRTTELEGAIEALERLRLLALELVDEDAAAYGAYAAASRMPRATPDEAAARAADLELATAAALAVPLKGARACADGLAAMDAVAGALNPHLASDAGVCALALSAALEGLGLNVAINAKQLRDRDGAAAALAELDALRVAAAARRDSILGRVRAAIDEKDEKKDRS